MTDDEMLAKRKSRVSLANMRKESKGSRSLLRITKSSSRTKMRKQSYGFGGVPGIKPIERTSQLAMEFKRPIPMYLNTYQLEPHVKFNVQMVTAAAEALLDEHFTGHKYNITTSPGIALRVAGDLMRNVKAMGFNRYRIIAVVTVAQKRSQSYNNAVTFLWDHERDNYVNLQREVTTAFIQITCFDHEEEIHIYTLRRRWHEDQIAISRTGRIKRRIGRFDYGKEKPALTSGNPRKLQYISLNQKHV